MQIVSCRLSPGVVRCLASSISIAIEVAGSTRWHVRVPSPSLTSKSDVLSRGVVRVRTGVDGADATVRVVAPVSTPVVRIASAIGKLIVPALRVTRSRVVPSIIIKVLIHGHGGRIATRVPAGRRLSQPTGIIISKRAIELVVSRVMQIAQMTVGKAVVVLIYYAAANVEIEPRSSAVALEHSMPA